MEEFEVFEIDITDSEKEYRGTVKAYSEPGLEGSTPGIFHVTLNSKFIGVISRTERGWRSNSKKTRQSLVDKIGEYITIHYR